MSSDVLDGPYHGRPPAVAGNDTSEAAADDIAADAHNLRTMVLGLIRETPTGLTCEEVEDELGMRHQTASARIRELVLLGRLVDSTARRVNRTGRTARVYVARY